LAMIGYGGTKPQNISVLNSQKGGKAYLLPCVPPAFKNHNVKMPSTDFFDDCLWPNLFKDRFHNLHKLLMADINNIHIREGRDNIWLSIFDRIVEMVWQVRNFQSENSFSERFDRLPKYQRVILDEDYRDERDSSEGYTEQFLKEIARWIVLAYRKLLANKALSLADDEISHIYKLISNKRVALS
jgi:CRISPR-associated protein Csy1